MSLFRFLHKCSKGRTAWFLLMLTTLGLIATSLFFQHVMMLMPCVLCIYQRIAIMVIFAVSLLGLLAPKSFLRYLAIIVWLYTAVRGLMFAMQQVSIQFKPSLTNACDLFPQFPAWLPLHQWFPSLFTPSGDCAARTWQFLSLEMSQWMVVVFSVYLFVAVLVAIAQFVKPKRTWWY